MYSSENVGKFDGVLVDGNQGAKRRSVGPIFKSTEDLRLSPSPDTTQKLTVDEEKSNITDNPEGKLEEKSYVRDDTVLLEEDTARHLSRKQVFFIVLGSILVLGIGIFSSLLITNKISLNSAQPVSKKITVIKKQPQTPTTATPAVSTSTNSQTTGSFTESQVTPQKTTTTKTTNSGASTARASTASTSNTSAPSVGSNTSSGSGTAKSNTGSSTPGNSHTGSTTGQSGTSQTQ